MAQFTTLVYYNSVNNSLFANHKNITLDWFSKLNTLIDSLNLKVNNFL